MGKSWNSVGEDKGSGLKRTYLWGMNLSGTMRGAEVVGGLLRHGFSTKQRDEETGWSYYGYRYYDAETGRWLSSDPIGERGGLNLYAFVLNRATFAVDRLGWEIHYPDGKPDPDAPDWDVPEGDVADGNHEGIECDGKGNARVRKGTGDGHGCCQKCIVEHEQSHADDVNGQKQNPCAGKPEGARPTFSDAAVQRQTEMKAYKAELECMKKVLQNIDKEPNPRQCEQVARARILTILNALRGLEELPQKKGQKPAVPLSYPDPNMNGYYEEGQQKIQGGDVGGAKKIISDIMSQ